MERDAVSFAIDYNRAEAERRNRMPGGEDFATVLLDRVEGFVETAKLSAGIQITSRACWRNSAWVISRMRPASETMRQTGAVRATELLFENQFTIASVVQSPPPRHPGRSRSQPPRTAGPISFCMSSESR